MHLDMNLLVALDALLEEGSVAGAAERLYLSAPAVSRTLARIRRATGDQILVRTGRTMTPTPYALAIRGEVSALVQRVAAVLSPARELRLATLERTFTLQCHDAVTVAIGHALLATIQEHAPGVTLRLLAEAPVDTNDLRHGQVDLAIGATDAPLPEISAETVGHDRLVLAVRAGHPLADGELTAERYAQARHVIISRRGRLHDPIDEALAARGLRRRVVASAPTSAAALHFVSQGDSVAAVAGQMCRAPIAALGLRTLPIPLPLAPVALTLTWHSRYDTDQAHAWLREQVRAALAAV